MEIGAKRGIEKPSIGYVWLKNRGVVQNPNMSAVKIDIGLVGVYAHIDFQAYFVQCVIVSDFGDPERQVEVSVVFCGVWIFFLPPFPSVSQLQGEGACPGNRMPAYCCLEQCLVGRQGLSGILIGL